MLPLRPLPSLPLLPPPSPPPQNRLMSICLVDTSTSRDVYVNDALVQQGLALFERDSLEEEMGTETYSLEGALSGVGGNSGVLGVPYLG